jgi:uncharacterized membrane-anchored protein
MQSARATWTDERLDDLSARVDRGFVELRTEMDVRFDRVDRDIRELRAGQETFRTEMKVGDDSLRGEVNARFDRLERTIHWFGGTMLGVFLAAFLAGAF